MTTAAAPAALDLARAARLFHALSDETRLAILAALGGGEQCVCDLQSALDAAQSRLSFHLRVLREAGLVTDRRSGRWMHYALAPDALAEAHDVVRALATEGFAGAVLPARAVGSARGTSSPRGKQLKVLGSCCG